MSTRAQNGGTNGGFSRRASLSSNRDPGDSLAQRVITLTAPAIGSTVTLATLGIGGNAKGTYVFTGTITDAGDGVEQIMFEIDGGTIGNRWYLRNIAANTATGLVCFLASVAGTVGLPGNIADATEFVMAVAIEGDGTARASLNGAAVVNSTGGPSSGLTTLRFGENAIGGAVMGGSIASMRIWGGVAVSDNELRAMSA